MKRWIYASLIGALDGLAKTANAPWWAVLVFGSLCLGFASLTVVFPQDSRDRLAWWQDRRARKTEHDNRELASRTKHVGESALNSGTAQHIDRSERM